MKNISEPHKKAIGKAQQKYFKLYHPEFGELEGYNLNAICKDKGYRHSDLRKVYLGRLYSSQGFYQSKESCENPQKWYDEHPLPTCDYPGVTYHRGNDRWIARFRKFTKLFKTKEEAIEALKEHKKSLGVIEE